MNQKYIILLQTEPNMWLAPWDGNPGRTAIERSAKQFTSTTGAETALKQAKELNIFPDAKVVEYMQIN